VKSGHHHYQSIDHGFSQDGFTWVKSNDAKTIGIFCRHSRRSPPCGAMNDCSAAATAHHCQEYPSQASIVIANELKRLHRDRYLPQIGMIHCRTDQGGGISTYAIQSGTRMLTALSPIQLQGPLCMAIVQESQ
jgi:hypothetical protein